MMGAMRVRLGSERLLESDALTHKRVGVVSNPASIDAHFRHIVRNIAAAPDVTLAAIFGPQHGYRADVQDNMIETAHAQDPARGVPVYSLYSETREPTAEMLAGLDALVIDLQDVGTRVYTYVWTLTHCLEACAEKRIPVLVLDRPNPLGGVLAEGPLLDLRFSSFVGRAAIPMRHGLTLGELARFCNDGMQLGADGVFVGSGIFKSEEPSVRAKAIVEATTHYRDPEILARVSTGLGDPMHGIANASLPPAELLQTRGW